MTLLVGLVVSVLVVVTAARLTRLLTQDAYPPTAWLRSKWDGWTEGSDWNMLLHCHWCLAPWMVLPLLVAARFALADHLPPFHPWQLLWMFMLWLTLSYAASWVVNNDEGFVVVREGE